jgi:hypothetical protein
MTKPEEETQMAIGKLILEQTTLEKADREVA